MALRGLELISGSDLTLDRESLSIVRKFRVLGTLPVTRDAFDTVASYVMAAIQVGGHDPNTRLRRGRSTGTRSNCTNRSTARRTKLA